MERGEEERTEAEPSAKRNAPRLSSGGKWSNAACSSLGKPRDRREK